MFNAAKISLYLIFLSLPVRAHMIPFAFLKASYVAFSSDTTFGENDDNIYSPLNYNLIMQSDGNLVLYDNGSGAALWNTGTFSSCNHTCTAYFQGGNIIVKNGSTVLYNTNLSGAMGAALQISVNRPYLQIIKAGTVLWNSGP